MESHVVSHEVEKGVMNPLQLALLDAFERHADRLKMAGEIADVAISAGILLEDMWVAVGKHGASSQSQN